MTAAGRSFTSNLLGAGWMAAMQLAFAPIFIRCVGIEGYGLIGFFVTMQAVLQVLDFGFAPTIGRWLARFAAGQEEARTTRDLTRTLEIVSWSVALSAGVVLAALAGPVARLWFRDAHLPSSVLRHSLVLMACTLTAQWPTTFYQSGLLGLRRAVVMNAAKAAAATASAAGAAAVLMTFAPTVPAYFAVQAIVAVLHSLVLRQLCWRAIAPPAGQPAKFRPEVLRIAGRFAAGMTGVALCAALVTQADRIIVSRLVPLEQFGYYVLAAVVASGLAVVIMPSHNTLFPMFSSLFAARNDSELRVAYHRGAQMLSVLLLPLACVTALFSLPILQVWTGNAAIAANTAPIATVLIIGTAINGLMHPPYALQLASGSTRLPFTLTLGQLVFIVPAVAFLALRFGVLGAAFAWPAMNALYLIIGSVWTFRLLLSGEWSEWIVRDVSMPLVAALLPVVLARLFIDLPTSRIGVAFVLVLAFGCSVLASVLAAPATRAVMLRYAQRGQAELL